MRNSYWTVVIILITLITLFSGSRASANTGREAGRVIGSCARLPLVGPIEATQEERPAERGEEHSREREKEDPKSCAGHALPANLGLPPYLVATLEQIYNRSSTFRRQCRRIADAPNLRVSVQLDGWMRTECRAFTAIRRHQGGVIDAQVHMPPNGMMFAELVSHEFEHIIEQLEGLNLREMAAVKGSGVHELERDLFETDRAQRAGKIVADEVRATRDLRPAAD
jgi:hypothetical protein